MALREVRRPVELEAAVRRTQRRDLHPRGRQHRGPAAIAAQLRPAGAAEREDGGIGPHLQRAVGRVEAQCAVVGPAGPALLDMQRHALRAQPPHPAAQQRCGLAVERKHASRAADVGIDAQATRPVAQCVGIEALEPAADGRGAFAVAAGEQRPRIGMGEVEPALARDQELASHRALGLEQVHREPGGPQAFGGHQAGRPAADHCDATCGMRVVHARIIAAAPDRTGACRG